MRKGSNNAAPWARHWQVVGVVGVFICRKYEVAKGRVPQVGVCPTPGFLAEALFRSWDESLKATALVW
ncbi:hypothetical protein MGG_15626 [Pyricularia oryzae 70-15]|uniref:Uncharacterized protein n=1 Tax=Pyricularia oryzae (strain 70-15 / ATCC MYA-4617 / FGSC 8958) TaxID=242507 RepID=G4MWH9_PYRO7|nr:uncharacterized protein MGG_15626 [Pyricularia oryzae 70-15]EHA54227.1 hypothetical protein MGG_15626 [Pyricularia oryzae 70-15]KAI7910282.1 hypothetical protein M0657_011433 [Pyricularia oryzae]KAI7920739.1 hypothetical protein M9X92_005745 [Pyricularia oryzae]